MSPDTPTDHFPPASLFQSALEGFNLPVDLFFTTLNGLFGGGKISPVRDSVLRREDNICPFELLFVEGFTRQCIGTGDNIKSVARFCEVAERVAHVNGDHKVGAKLTGRTDRDSFSPSTIDQQAPGEFDRREQTWHGAGSGNHMPQSPST